MCGIIAYAGDGDAGDIVLDGLETLEYRGYDSSGIAVLEDEALDIVKAPEEIGALTAGHDIPRNGRVAVGHTRWATHGGVTRENAHPHTSCDERFALVHNGIVENYKELKQRLGDHTFTSETDSEVIAHFIEDEVSEGRSVEDAIERFLAEAEGALAVVLVDRDTGTLYGFRRGSPLAVGMGDGEWFIASDANAFSDHTRNAIFMEDEEYVVINGRPAFHRADGEVVEKEPIQLGEAQLEEGKQGYDHYMLKEITEQPEVLRRLQNSLATEQGEALARLQDLIERNDKVIFTAAGTSYHASLLGVYYLQKAGVEAQTLIASEFQNYERVDDDTLVVAVSQSGETRDTLDAVEFSRAEGADIAAIVNTPHSSLERESDATLHIEAGKETCVAATKTFSATVLALVRLAQEAGYDASIADVEEKVRKTIEENRETVQELAERFSAEDDMYIIGRGSTYPVAREIALKLKEVPYIHAEGMMGGELKHGTLALIEDGTPVFALVPGEDDEILSNVSEIEARGGDVVAISPERGPFHLPNGSDAYPILATTIGFLLAYELGVARDCPIDKPRNLAKTVTVR
ncbi:MAG: glutamine--fructose-6-phosphate transaminase (isomerizing) [Candidatus Nanohaloarchaea archaeon]|nr:glutamine--fructose-6-phosphate transaminase (isomerizing) [Candidatus Nanohaloarchaea archaeon]